MRRAALESPIEPYTASDPNVQSRAVADVSVDSQASLPIWMWPHMLSLDVALVFVTWAALFSASFRVPLQLGTVLVGAAAVWCIYVADHLLDAHSPRFPATERHQFAYRHRRILIPFVIIATDSGAIGALKLPPEVLFGGLLLVAAVALYFVIVHVGGKRLRRYWPKEIMVAAVFAVGCVLPTRSFSYAPAFAAVGLLLLFALFVLNCAGLEYREWTTSATALARPHAGTLFVGRHARAFGVGLAALSLIACLIAELRPIAVCVASSSLLLSAVFTEGRSWRVGPLRAAADLMLLTPLLVLPLVWR